MKFLAYSAFLLLFLSSLLAQEPDDEKDDHQRERQEYFYRQRAYPLARIPEGARLKAIQALDRLDRAQRFQAQSASPAAAASAWKLIGPEPTSFLFGGYVTAGRVNAIAIDPRDSNTVYIGAAEGGVWKTKDGGITWTPLTDGQPSLAMGAIVLDPTNPDIVYAGTGEENFAVDNYYGAGILKSTDGGATWTNIVGPFLRRTISALAIHPSNGQILLAATDAQGVFRSTDGGATWNSVLGGAAAISVYFDTSNQNNAYASLGDPHGSPANGVYHSTDSGLTWTAIKGTGTNTLPLTNAGRIELAVAPSNPSVLYAGLQNSGEDYGTSLGIFKSIDGGVSWRQLPSVSPDWCRKQCWYDMTIHVSPKDPNVVYAGGLQIMRSLDGGVTWTTLDANFSQVHVDQHFMAFTNDASKLYAGNDGGVWSTTDVSAPDVTWHDLNNALVLAQFYPGMSIHPSNASLTLAGTQDNGTQRYSGAVDWDNVACGDGGWTALDTAFPSVAYAACQNIQILKSFAISGSNVGFRPAQYGIDQTDRGRFIPPFVIDPSSPRTLYFGTYRLYQTTDGAGRWRAISPDLTRGSSEISAIRVAPSDSKTVYVGTLDSKVQVTNNASAGTAATWTDRSNGLPTRSVTQIVADPTDAGTVYVTFSGFGGGHIFKTANGGALWSDISGNLPDIPVNDLVVDPDLPAVFYAATDAGVQTSTDGGATWSSLGAGLPKVVVLSLVLHRPSRTLRAASHGRGAWDFALPLSSSSRQPSISAISPGGASAGSAALQLTVSGSNFASGTTVRWNGQDRPTNVSSAQSLSVQIPSSDLAAPGSAAVLAFSAANGGGASNPVNFVIGPAPVINPGGIVSAANPASAGVFAPGSIAALYGANLAPGTHLADLAPPLPFGLAGVSLQVGPSAAPLFFVSANQINFQVPWFFITGTPTVAVTSSLDGQPGSSVFIKLVPYSPTLFTTNQSGSGQGAVINYNANGAVAAPVGAFPGSRPAKAGEILEIYGTGLGDVINRPFTGSVAPSNPLATTVTKPDVTIGGVAAPVKFSGLAPGFVGLYQVNVTVPKTAPSGNAVPLILTIGAVASNTVTVAIQ